MRRGFFFLFTALVSLASSFDHSAKHNVVLYFGQEGGTLASVCKDPSVDVVALAFLTEFFGTGGLPVINFAGSCNGATFPGTDLLECTEIGQDIRTCQNSGKIVLLSLGGAIGNYGFSSSSQAQTFATTLWNLFGEGTSDTRPFGTSVVDGFDLDIENQQPSFYSDFITAMRGHFDTGSKQYFISGAPQCVFPDASLGQALDSSPFDMVFVQFYNNPPCGVEGSGFNYDTWQSWATSSRNKDVKVYVGVPGSTAAAGSGYITPAALENIITSVVGQDNFGGIMMWDANQAFANVNNGVNYAQAAKNALVSVAGNSSSSTGSGTTPKHKTATANTATVTPAANSPAAAETSVTPAVQSPAGASPTTIRTVTVTHKHNTVAGAGKGVSSNTNEATLTQEASVSAAAATSGASSTSSCTSGVIDCIGGQFAQCVNGAWVLTSCPAHTTCTKIGVGDSEVITCDYPTSRKHRRSNAKRHVHGHRHVLIDADHRT